MSILKPTLVFEEIGTGKILYSKLTSFADFKKKQISQQMIQGEHRYVCYLQIESRMNLSDNKFNKRRYEKADK